MGWLIVIFLFFAVTIVVNAWSEDQDKQKANEEILKRRQDAEDYIMSSRDPQAIQMLMRARENPAKYNQVLEAGMNQGNDTLETAFGIITGYLIFKSLVEPSVSSASENMQAKQNDVDVDSCDDWDMTDDDFDDFYFHEL